MENMKMRQRWMPLPWGVILLPIMLILLGSGVYANLYYPDDRPTVRIMLPLYAIGVYLTVALLVNWRTVQVTPMGLSVSVWPFVVRQPRRLTRDQVHFCYIRNVRNYDDGTLLESYYSAGVQSLSGEQIDASTPHSTAQEATQVANRMADILNQSSTGSHIEVYEVDQLPERAEVLATLLFMGVWLAIAIGAILLGFEWEERQMRGAAPPALRDHCASLARVVTSQDL
jgi:hypothetical protein